MCVLLQRPSCRFFTTFSDGLLLDLATKHVARCSVTYLKNCLSSNTVLPTNLEENLTSRGSHEYL